MNVDRLWLAPAALREAAKKERRLVERDVIARAIEADSSGRLTRMSTAQLAVS